MNKKKTIIISILILICISIFHIILINNKTNKISKLEEIKIKEISNKVTNNISIIKDKKNNSIDKYIIYSLYYNYNENNKTTLTSKEMINIINNIFSIEINEESLIGIGITPNMLDKHITYDVIEKIFKLNIEEISYSDIAGTPISYYEIKNIKKDKEDKYIVTYNEYTFNNLYEVLNYYEEQNNLNNKNIDTTSLENYLKGKESISNIKKYFTKDIISKYSKNNKEIKIIYIIKDNKVLIKEIK